MTTPTPAAAGAPAGAPSTPSTPSGPPPGAPSNPGGTIPLPGGGTPLPGAPKPPAQAGPAPGAPAPAPKFKRTLTINGKQEEIEVGEEELWSSYQKSRAADARFEEAARLRKEAQEKIRAQEQLSAAIKKNPRELMRFLQEQGVEDPLDLLANVLQEQIAEEERLADPNVRARVQAERELEALRQEKQQRELSEQLDRFDQEVQAEFDNIKTTFSEALGKLDPELAADDDAFSIMAQLEQVNRRKGIALSSDQLAALTQERIMKRPLSLMRRLPPEKLLALDPELTKLYRAAFVTQYRARSGAPVTTTPPAPAPPPQPPAPTKRVVSDKEELELIGGGRRILRTI